MLRSTAKVVGTLTECPWMKFGLVFFGAKR
jgi:hypothetical protein